MDIVFNAKHNGLTVRNPIGVADCWRQAPRHHVPPVLVVIPMHPADLTDLSGDSSVSHRCLGRSLTV